MEIKEICIHRVYNPRETIFKNLGGMVVALMNHKVLNGLKKRVPVYSVSAHEKNSAGNPVSGSEQLFSIQRRISLGYAAFNNYKCGPEIDAAIQNSARVDRNPAVGGEY